MRDVAHFASDGMGDIPLLEVFMGRLVLDSDVGQQVHFNAQVAKSASGVPKQRSRKFSATNL